MEIHEIGRQVAGVIAIYLQNAQNVVEVLENILEGDDEEEENATMVHIITSQNEPATRIENYVEQIVSNQNEREFQSHFRLRYEAFQSLENRLGPELSYSRTTNNPELISVRKQLLVILWLLATPDSFRSVGDRFDLPKASVHRCFIRVVKLLNKLSPDIIKWPSVSLRSQIKEDFSKSGGLMGVVGAIDGTFVEINAPKEHPHVYTCRKCFYAIQLQAIAVPNLKFIDIFTGYPGSVGDRRVFHNSDIYHNINSNRNDYIHCGEYIIGDKAYPILPWCIPPYIRRRQLTVQQTNFNNKHARTRQVVERSFALLFGRYRRLKYLHMNSTEMIPATILSACVLHNICLDYADLEFNNQAIMEGENFMVSQEERYHHNNSENITQEISNVHNDGDLMRDRLAQSLI